VRYENIRWDVKTEFWGFCSFASLSSVLAYEKIHRLNGLVYYFLYSGRSLCDSPAKKSATFHSLSPSFLQLSVFQAMFPLPLIPFLMIHQSKNAPCNLHVEVFYVSQVSLFTFFFRTINHKLVCVRPRRMVV